MTLYQLMQICKANDLVFYTGFLPATGDCKIQFEKGGSIFETVIPWGSLQMDSDPESALAVHLFKMLTNARFDLSMIKQRIVLPGG